MKQISRNTLISCQNCYLHRVSLGGISLISFGNLEIFVVQRQTEQHTYINVGDFNYFVQKEQNIVMNQLNSITTFYLLDGNKGIYAFTLSSKQQNLLNLEKTFELARISITKTENLDSKPELKNWMEIHRPTFRTENVICSNSFNRLISRGGVYINTKLGNFQNKMVDKIKNKADNMIINMNSVRDLQGESQQNTQNQTIKKIKSGINYLFEKNTWLNSVITDPIVSRLKKGSNKLSQKIDKSNSSFLKRTKQFLSISELSIRNGFNGIKNSITGIGGRLIHDGKQIIALKMKPKPQIADVAVVVEKPQSQVDKTDVPINNNKQEMVYPQHPLHKIQAPKLSSISIQKQIDDKVDLSYEVKDGILKMKNTLEELSQNQSVEEQLQIQTN